MEKVCSVCGKHTKGGPVCKVCGWKTVNDITVRDSLVEISREALAEFNREMTGVSLAYLTRVLKRINQVVVLSVAAMTSTADAKQDTDSTNQLIKNLFLSEGDYREAERLHQKIDRDNIAVVLNRTGERYENKLEIKDRKSIAYKYYLRARQAGSKLGFLNLIRCYEEGIGVPRNQKKARELYRDYLNQYYK